MKRQLCFRFGLTLLALAVNLSAQTVTVTAKGGNWNDVNTWTPRQIPNANTDVIITSDTVGLAWGGTFECKNLTINAGAALVGYATLRIWGNITNNGAFSANRSGENPNPEIAGNITNNGIWNCGTVSLTGSTDQLISQSAGTSFEGTNFFNTDTLGIIKAGTDLIFKTSTSFLAQGAWTTLDMQGHNITVDGINRPTLSYLNLGLLWDVVIINPGTINVINNGDLHFVYCKGNPTLSGQVLVSGNTTFEGTVTLQGVLGRGAAANYIRFNNLINNGTIGSDVQSIEVSGDITNNGVWMPGVTYLTGTKGQQLSQESGKSFEGDMFRNSDTLGAKAASALTFKAGTDFGNTVDARWGTLNMQNYALTIDGSNRGTLSYLDKGYVMNCVITNPGDITCLNNGVLHMSNCTGNPSLKGRFFVGSYVTFSGNVTVIDSIMSSGATPVSIVGAIRNRGVVTGNLALDVAGDITNEATWNTLGTTNLYTNGGNRKIKGVFDAALVMNQTGTPAAGIVQVDLSFTNNKSLVLFSNLNLEVPKGSVFINNGDMTLYGSITNKGKIVYRKKITSAGTYSFYAASASIPSIANLDSLIMEHYANQVMTTFSNAVTSRWNIITRPGSVLANATSLTFYYSDAGLGSNKEAILQVYQASDSVSWKLISTVANTTRDTVNNTMTITGSPLYGNYVLASSSPNKVEREQAAMPLTFDLKQNYPNPFNPSTMLRYELPMNSHVTLRMYSILGQLVAELVNSKQSAGQYQMNWNANVASGVYIYRLEAVSSSDPSKQFVDVKKMILMR